MNTAECRLFLGTRQVLDEASMEPPCEHGGVLFRLHGAERAALASMEPPCEHGGVAHATSRSRTAPSCFNGAAV